MDQTNKNLTDTTIVVQRTAENNELVQPSEGISKDAQAIITVLCLIFVYPVGFIVMWVWTEWPIWLRLLLSIPVILLIIVLFSFPTILQSIMSHPTAIPSYGFR